MRPLLFILAAAAAFAQAPDPPPTFKAGTAIVRVDVQVIHRNKPVGGLTASDFSVTDAGQPAGALTLDKDNDHLEVLLLLDVSGSMGQLLGRMGSVAQKALAVLKPDDKVGVMLFARRSEVVLEPDADRRAAVAVIRDAAVERNSTLGAGSSLNEAVMAAAEYFKQRPYDGRRALVVLTDNGGLSKELPDEKVIQSLAEAEVVLNGIVPDGVDPPRPPPKGVEVNPDYTPANIFRLAEESGGEWMRSDKPEKLGEMLDRIRQRYTIYYPAPESAPGLWRALEVTLSPATRARYGNAKVRSRPGYFSGPVQAASSSGSGGAPWSSATPR
jgi:VWFA-related protein